MDDSDDDSTFPDDGVVFLPTTPSRLWEKLDNLFVEFARDGKMENRNEMVCILYGLKRQGSIS